MELHKEIDYWLWFMELAFGLAFAASLPPRRPIRTWFGDFLVRWGLSGLFIWFVVNGFWAVRELLGQKYIIPFAPIEGYLEHATVWGAVLTGLVTFLFFGSTLFLRAIFDVPYTAASNNVSSAAVASNVAGAASPALNRVSNVAVASNSYADIMVVAPRHEKAKAVVKKR
ncbi:MAG: hypothetical protein ABWK05_07170 [Pyrobaculum sp.]